MPCVRICICITSPSMFIHPGDLSNQPGGPGISPKGGEDKFSNRIPGGGLFAHSPTRLFFATACSVCLAPRPAVPGSYRRELSAWQQLGLSQRPFACVYVHDPYVCLCTYVYAGAVVLVLLRVRALQKEKRRHPSKRLSHNAGLWDECLALPPDKRPVQPPHGP